MFFSSTFHYIPGEKTNGDIPLGRYLPPFRNGVVSSWLSNNVSPSCWVIDPFGSSPELICEIASSGYKVLACVNNPIIRFILDMQCLPRNESNFQSAIAFLASSQVGDERLEPHIKSLYETICDGCGRIIQAESFIWKRGETVPSGRIYTCSYCGDSGERAVTQYDIEKASRFVKHGLHRARALERVTPINDRDRHHVEEALEVYLPRAIYALITILNKLVSIPTNDPLHPILNSLLLLAFDRANTLWSYPKVRQRPKQLTVPPQFLEHNIWLAIETAIRFWIKYQTQLPISKWPQEPPPNGGICVYDGRIKSLSAELSNIRDAAVVTSFPRPNQAFWTLSALWAGWLWGHGALDHFKIVLRRRRYDWSWHINAIHTALNFLVPSLPERTPYFGLINEVEPSFLSAVILGGYLSNLEINGIALRAEEGQAQIFWQATNNSPSINIPEEKLEDKILASTKAYLSERGEPCSYTYIHASGLVGLSTLPNHVENITPGDYLTKVHGAFQDCLTIENGFIRYAGSDKSLDVGSWWLQDLKGEILPLSDRIEMAIIDHLLKNPGQSIKEIDMAICQGMSGLSPPDTQLIYECLQSYSYKPNPEIDQYFLVNQEQPNRRRSDLLEISECLHRLGGKLGYKTSEKQENTITVHWIAAENREEYVFYLSETGLLGKYLDLSIPPHQKPFIVMPGSRANLIAFKLDQNPYLKQIADSKWGFIKFRLIRQLVDSEIISTEKIDELFGLDPIAYSAPQIRMF